MQITLFHYAHGLNGCMPERHSRVRAIVEWPLLIIIASKHISQCSMCVRVYPHHRGGARC